jgi:hypothetical protein
MVKSVIVVLVIGGGTGNGVMIFCIGFSVMVSDSGLNGGSGCGFNDFKQITI